MAYSMGTCVTLNSSGSYCAAAIRLEDGKDDMTLNSGYFYPSDACV